MKTPKRYQNKTIPTMPEDSEPDWDIINAWCQRAKRKNRIAQLKRSINKYRDGTNLTFYSHELHAYKRLQELKRPGKKATVEDWEFYIHSLKSIHCHIWQAIHQAEREQEQAPCQGHEPKLSQ